MKKEEGWKSKAALIYYVVEDDLPTTTNNGYYCSKLYLMISGWISDRSGKRKAGMVGLPIYLLIVSASQQICKKGGASERERVSQVENERTNERTPTPLLLFFSFLAIREVLQTVIYSPPPALMRRKRRVERGE